MLTDDSVIVIPWNCIKQIGPDIILVDIWVDADKNINYTENVTVKALKAINEVKWRYKNEVSILQSWKYKSNRFKTGRG